MAQARELAPVIRRREDRCVAVSARCKLPGHDGCNKTVALGHTRTLPEARRHLMQWCINGIGTTCREEHMCIMPRECNLSEIATEEELLNIANEMLESIFGIAQQ